MTAAELKAQIISNTLNSIYIFTGTEIEVRNIFINQIASLGYNVVRAEELSDIYSNLKRQGMASKPTLYVVAECSELLKNEKSWKVFNINIGKNMLVFTFTSLDKRVKFYKQYKDLIVEFEPLKPELLKKYILKEIDLSDKNCDKLIEICEGDYGRCLLEIDKIKHFVAGYGKDKQMQMPEEGGFLRLLSSGVIYQPPKDAIFDFVDAVLNRDANRSFKLMRESYDSGEATLVMVSNLYSNFKSLLQVQSCKSRDISNATGLTGWQISNAKKYLNKYRTGELVNAIHSIRNIEIGIKTGMIEEQIAIPYLLCGIL